MSERLYLRALRSADRSSFFIDTSGRLPDEMTDDEMNRVFLVLRLNGTSGSLYAQCCLIAVLVIFLRSSRVQVNGHLEYSVKWTRSDQSHRSRT